MADPTFRRPPQNPVQELLSLYAAGRVRDMEQRARALLKTAPDAAILYELLGMALSAQQRHADALPPLQEAVRRVSTDAQFWENLALCQRELSQWVEAEQSLRRSLAIRPAAPDTLNALGSVLRALKREDEAQSVFGEALALAPEHAGANFNLGKGLVYRDPVKAEAHLRRAIAGNPAFAGGYYELGLAQSLLNKRADEEASFRRAISLDASMPGPHAALAVNLMAQDRMAEAVASARTAVTLLGGIERRISTDDIVILDRVAFVFDGAKEYRDAIKIFKATLGLERHPFRALAALGCARQICDWDFASSLEAEARRVGYVGTDTHLFALPWHLFNVASATAQEQLAAVRSAAGIVARNVAILTPATAPSPQARAGGRLRVGYFSCDLRSHAVGNAIVGVIEAHDRGKFEIVAVDFSPPSANDAQRQRLEQAFERIIPIGQLSSSAATRRIAEERLDILIDVTGWTGVNNRVEVLVHRPAPVQMQWLGHAGSMGAPWIDYVVGDPVLIRPGDEANFSEKIIRLPDSFMPHDDKRAVASAPTREQHRLPREGFVFCSFNRAYKFTPEMFDVWMRLLNDVEGSVLWLAAPAAEAQSALRDRAALRGVEPDRVLFGGAVPEIGDHLARLGLADLALDCFPYGSHTTACDKLWAGVPLVSLAGDTFASRVSASILTAAGLPDLVTTSLDEYRALALRLATDRGALAELKLRTRASRRSPLFDTQRFTRNLEQALLAAFARHAGGLPPDHIAI